MRGTKHDYPVIVLYSPSTPSCTGSSEDTYSNRVYTTTIIEENNFYNDDNCHLVNIHEVMDECNEQFGDYVAHSKYSVSSERGLLKNNYNYESERGSVI